MFTVKDLMNLPMMSEAKVLSASSVLESRAIESVSVIEIPVENFVRRNEFVLTTAIGCGDHPKEFERFVWEVQKSEATALAVAVGRHVHHIPADVLRFAEKHGFPIIELPWEIRFADVMQAVLDELHNWHRSVLKRSEEVQKHLLDLFMRGADLTEIAEDVGRKTGYPAVISDDKGAVRAASQHSTAHLAKWREHYTQAITDSLSWNALPAPQHLALTNLSYLSMEDTTLLRLEIRSGGKMFGYLLLLLPSESPQTAWLTNDHAHVLRHAATVAALWFQREHTIKETELRYRGDFVWSLAKGEIDSWDMVLSRAKTLQYNLSLPYVCLLGFPENMESRFQGDKTYKETYEQWLHMMIGEIEQHIAQVGINLQRRVMHTYHSGHFIVFLEVPPERISDAVNSFIHQLENRFSSLLPGLVMSWGIGDQHAGVKTFSESYDAARLALDIGRSLKGPGHRSTYTDTGIYRALHSLAKNRDIRESALSTVRPLADYDSQRDADLIPTLVAYIRNLGNISQTARMLNLHRQSLLYRLRKIESLTNRSLLDPDDLFLLDLSIKLWKIGLAQGDHSDSSLP